MTIRDKLKALTAPCREVDAEIAEMFGTPVHPNDRSNPRDAWGDEVPHHTASLDATVELIERELPYAEVCLNIYGMAFAMVYNGGGPSKEVEHHHTIPAVALLLALLDTKGIE